MHTYELITYDLINDGESLSVNDIYKTGITLDLDETVEDKVIISELKQLGILNLNAHYKNFEIDGEPEYVYYINFKGNPCCELRNIGGDNA